MIINNFSRVLDQYNKEHKKKLSLRAIARIIGATTYSITSLYNGKAKGIKFDVLNKLINFFNVPLNQLISYQYRNEQKHLHIMLFNAEDIYKPKNSLDKDVAPHAIVLFIPLPKVRNNPRTSRLFASVTFIPVNIINSKSYCGIITTYSNIDRTSRLSNKIAALIRRDINHIMNNKKFYRYFIVRLLLRCMNLSNNKINKRILYCCNFAPYNTHTKFTIPNFKKEIILAKHIKSQSALSTFSAHFHSQGINKDGFSIDFPELNLTLDDYTTNNLK